jgi:hypothetical protein
VPSVYCVETIWADSAIAALKSMGQNDLIEQINLPRLCATCINSNTKISKQVISSLKDGSILRKQNFQLAYILFVWYLFLLKLDQIPAFYKRVRNRILISIGKKNFQRIDGLVDINEATFALTNCLSKKKYVFSEMNKKIIVK